MVTDCQVASPITRELIGPITRGNVLNFQGLHVSASFVPEGYDVIKNENKDSSGPGTYDVAHSLILVS